jgi:hypothetical protein
MENGPYDICGNNIVDKRWNGRLAAGSREQGAGQTTYAPIFTATDKPWFAQVSEGANNTSLGTVSGQSIKFGDNGANYTSLDSNIHGDIAYMYADNGKGGGGGKSVIKVTFYNGGNYMKCQFIKND